MRLEKHVTLYEAMIFIHYTVYSVWMLVPAITTMIHDTQSILEAAQIARA